MRGSRCGLAGRVTFGRDRIIDRYVWGELIIIDIIDRSS
jgi:hypothetical protein